MQTSSSEIIPVLLVGTLIMVVLTTFIFLFVILYQRKMIKFQMEMRKLQDEKQRQLLAAVFETQEGERSRLAEDLHDSVGQVLSAIKLNLHRLEKFSGKPISEEDPQRIILTNTKKLLDECLMEIRHIIRNVLPPILVDFGLFEALENLSKKVQNDTGIQVIFIAKGSVGRYKKDVEVMMYRIVQELFNNSIKHANASQIKLELKKQNEFLHLRFEDNGTGFNAPADHRGFGLKNIESRIQLMEGHLDFNSAEDKGFSVVLKVPLKEELVDSSTF